jgi:DNA-binding IclR family transcriptional regulator
MFTDYFGDTPRARLLDFLGDHPTSDYSKTELAAKAAMTRQTLYTLLPDLERTGMVRRTRTIGQSTMYALVPEHPVVAGVLGADMAAAEDALALMH